MNMHTSLGTETEMAALKRRREFHGKIAAMAAALTAPIKPPAPVAAIEPEAMPAETDPPAPCQWFWPAEWLPFQEVRKIQECVGKYYGVTRADLMSERRMKELIRPRHVAIYLAKQLTPLSLPSIGRRFGGRDHTTILHAVRKIEALARLDRELAFEVAVLVDTLTDGKGI
jgi:hypothetical protein